MRPSKSAWCLVQCLGVQYEVVQDRGAGVMRGHQMLEEGDRFG